MRAPTQPLLLTWSLTEAAAILGIPPHLLTKWVETGRIRPALPGSRGKGNVARFSAQQLLGLATVVGLRAAQGRCGTAYAKAVIASFEAMPDALLEQWFTRKDPWVQELMAEWRQTPVPEAGNSAASEPDEEIERAFRVVCGLHRRVERAIHLKRGIFGPALDPSRFAQQAKEQGKTGR